MIAMVADGDISQYHFIRREVNIKTIGVFLSYRVKKAKAQVDGLSGLNGL